MIFDPLLAASPVPVVITRFVDDVTATGSVMATVGFSPTVPVMVSDERSSVEAPAMEVAHREQCSENHGQQEETAHRAPFIGGSRRVAAGSAGAGSAT